MDVVHVLRSFGDQNQPYTTHLLNTLNTLSTLKHAVVCDNIYQSSKTIAVYSMSSKLRVKHFLDARYVLHCFFNKALIASTSGFSFKKRIKFFLKWKFFVQHEPSVIHLHHLQAFNVSILKFLYSKKIPVIVSFRGKDIVTNPLEPQEQALLFEKLKYIDRVHVISEYLKVVTIQAGVTLPIDVVYRGIGKTPLNRPALKLNTNTPIKIICVGRLAWEKGQFYLLDSVYRLKQKGYTFNVDIYGEGYLREFLLFRIQQLGLEGQVNLKGHVDSELLTQNYKTYHLAVQPSLYEALSNGLLDLVNNNVPCVISKGNGMEEVIADQINGVYFDVNTPETLDTAILDVLKLDTETLMAYNEGVRNQFSFNEEIKGLERMYLNYKEA
ncbi:glycosyltransferase family 4 protein [Formosa sp. A9]|uniref:glycosyltransferase family 4 protein n=1 Tax=Formosa sp. A9 TaxID=3442641 RepID=UPI003EBCC6F2